MRRDTGSSMPASIAAMQSVKPSRTTSTARGGSAAKESLEAKSPSARVSGARSMARGSGDERGRREILRQACLRQVAQERRLRYSAMDDIADLDELRKVDARG